jgi:SNF2 family DNA or RNA helicase
MLSFVRAPGWSGSCVLILRHFILRHFILRRTKAQVADELPARTEVTLEIEPTAAARAYYEALRRRALESVEGGDPRSMRFRILAEITRLRQAAVDPRLLNEREAPAGAKIDALVEHVLALREEATGCWCSRSS